MCKVKSRLMQYYSKVSLRQLGSSCGINSNYFKCECYPNVCDHRCIRRKKDFKLTPHDIKDAGLFFWWPQFFSPPGVCPTRQPMLTSQCLPSNIPASLQRSSASSPPRRSRASRWSPGWSSAGAATSTGRNRCRRTPQLQKQTDGGWQMLLCCLTDTVTLSRLESRCPATANLRRVRHNTPR